MFRIRRFGIIKTATTVAAIYVLVILIVAIPFAVLALLAGGFETTSGRVGVVEVLTVTVVAILVYGGLGWLFTAIGCALYNAVASLTGGVEFQLDASVPSTPTPAPWGPTAIPPPPTSTPPSTPEA